MLKRVFLFIRDLFIDTYDRANIVQRNGVRMGQNCQVFRNCSFGSEPYLIQFGNYVKVTKGCQFITHDGGVEVLRNLYPDLVNADLFGRILIGNNVFIGNNCIIMPNVTIGDNVVIGAGAVVTKSFPSNLIIAGIPAKIIKNLDEYKVGVKSKVVFTKQMTKNDKKEFLEKKYRL